MNDNAPKLTFFHSPRTRSAGTYILLEELGIPYELKVVNVSAKETRAPEFLAINPMGKVPAILHGEALVTEQVAISIYLADYYADAKLAVMDRAMGRDSGKQQSSGYGDYDSVMKVIIDQLKAGPYLLGDTFSAADVLWGSALGWTSKFKLIPDDPAINDYVKRMAARPASVKVQEKDAALTKA